MSETATMSGPNASSTAPAQNAVLSDADIFAKMTAMRNQVQETAEAAAPGSEKSAPVAPQGTEVIDDNTESIEPEVEPTETLDQAEATEEASDPQEVSPENSTAEELIDFIEFANDNPKAKFKFTRNGKEVVIDAKKAAAILGQGGAIHEEARELKIQRAAFDEYLKDKTQQAEGLLLAMEFTIKPQIQKAYDEILKTQGYQTTFKQQLAQTQDPAQIARIQAAMQQNEQYIAQQGNAIRTMKPQVDQFYALRKQQVQGALDQSRRAFQDPELKNEYVFNEIREKLSKNWEHGKKQFVIGVDNLDLVSSDEYLMGLIKDGMKFREKPKGRSAGSSIAALTSKRAGAVNSSSSGRDETEQLRAKAKAGDKKAGDNLLAMRLNQIRSQRGGR
jgi:hypothetical protein